MTTSEPRRQLLATLSRAVVEAVTAWLVLAPGLVPLVLGLRRVLDGGLLAGLGLAGVGGAATAALAVLAARPLASAALRRGVAGRPRRRVAWLDARSLVWLAATLTIRSGLAVLGLLLGVVAAAALAAPVMVHTGDRVDLGPWRVHTLPAALLSAGLGVLLLAGLALACPPAARGDRHLASAILCGDQGELEHQLAATSSSRARIVSAFDLERRRIERDLHDGIQPELLGVSMTLGLALATMADDDPARALVTTAQDQSLAVLDHLRRFVRGIHPQVLDDHGLAAALGELAGGLPVPVSLDDQLGRRLPEPVESSLYYACAELLANVAKHAHASHAGVTLAATRGRAVVRVTDDGRGGADPAGRGLLGVADRLGALDGSLVLDSPPGGPTVATLTVPLRGDR